MTPLRGAAWAGGAWALAVLALALLAGCSGPPAGPAGAQHDALWAHDGVLDPGGEGMRFRASEPFEVHVWVQAAWHDVELLRCRDDGCWHWSSAQAGACATSCGEAGPALALPVERCDARCMAAGWTGVHVSVAGEGRYWVRAFALDASQGWSPAAT